MCMGYSPDALKALQKPASAPSAEAVPLGDGLAQNARLAIMSRQARIDAAVKAKQ